MAIISPQAEFAFLAFRREILGQCTSVSAIRLESLRAPVGLHVITGIRASEGYIYGMGGITGCRPRNVLRIRNIHMPVKVPSLATNAGRNR